MSEDQNRKMSSGPCKTLVLLLMQDLVVSYLTGSQRSHLSPDYPCRILSLAGDFSCFFCAEQTRENFEEADDLACLYSRYTEKT
jgi:hypothetical protein